MFLSTARCLILYISLSIVSEATTKFHQSFLFALAQRLKQTLEPCDTEYPAFVSERTIKETTGSIDCDDCLK